MGSLKKLAIVAALAVAVVALATLRPAGETPKAEALIATGGISALPSAAPAIPGLTDQILPAIIPASGPGNTALISVFCDTVVGCPDASSPAGPTPDGFSRINFKVEALDLAAGGTKATSASIVGVCHDGATCDLTGATDSTVVVPLSGGGKDEVLVVTATDELGDSQSVTVITVQTMIGVPPVLEPFTEIIPGLPGLGVIGYRCNDIGRADFSLGGIALVDTLGDMWNVFYSPGFATLPSTIDFFRCGGDTFTPTDNFVSLTTDKGILNVDPVSLFVTIIGVVLAQCSEGKSVSVEDGGVWQFAFPASFQGCDIDGAPNGTVGYTLQRTGDTGVATITGNQGGHAGSTRSVNVNMIGGPTLAIDLSNIPDVIGILNPVAIQVAVLSTQGGGPSPVAGITVVCSVAPADAAFSLLPDRDTTGADGLADLTLVPTGLPGSKFTLTCRLDGHPEVAPTSKEISLSLTPDRETVDLTAGCNLKSFMPAYAAGTSLKTITDDVAGGDPRIWLQRGATEFALFDPDSAERSTVTTLGAGDEAGFLCVDEDTTWSRPA